MTVHAKLAAAAVLTLLAGAAQAEIITVRSGQVGGLPGLVGQPDDVVTYLANNPIGAPVSGSLFTAADFAGAVSGPAAFVIQPHPAWTSNISDPAARWINYHNDPVGMGFPGSTLYAVPFFVNTPGATGGYLNLEFMVDDVGGDQNYGGPNTDFLYVNGVSTGFSGGNFAVPTIFSQFISFSQGLNYLYMYQRDVGATVSGLIFSATITVVPTPAAAPAAAAAMGFGGLLASRRRR